MNSIVLFSCLGFLGLGFLFLVFRYNRLVGLRNKVKAAFSQIDVQMKRRYDLIPNLVEATKGYLAHERDTLMAVVEARNLAVRVEAGVVSAQGDGQGSLRTLFGADAALSGALGRLFAVMEAYPDLKANQTVASLMEELSTSENLVAFSRQFYNDAVMVYNTALEVFPDVLFAKLLGFSASPLYLLEEAAAREVPKVDLGA